MDRKVLQGGFVVTLGPAGILPVGTVVIEDGYVVEVGPARNFSGPEVVDCRNRLLMPGLCNAHLHSEFLLFKGLLEERRLAAWEEAPFYDRAWDRLETPLDLELLAPTYRASYLEQVLSGVTFVGEFNCVNGSAPLSEAILMEVGLRGTATFKPHEPRPVADAVPIYYMHHEGGLSEEELLEAMALIGREAHARFTLHAAETLERMTLVQERFGTTTIRLLERSGLLSPQMLLSHAVHVDAEEVAILARRGARVIASPTAEMKLADGVSPVLAYLEAGVPVCLGTDCATCNNGGDMFLEMKTLGLLHKLTSGAHALPAETLLQMATVEGFRAFGLEDVGMLEPGFRADLIALDRWSPGLNPLIHRPGAVPTGIRGVANALSNVHANLVYGATGRDVRDVMVGGEWIVRDGRHRTLETGAVFQALHETSEKLWGEVLG